MHTCSESAPFLDKREIGDAAIRCVVVLFHSLFHTYSTNERASGALYGRQTPTICKEPVPVLSKRQTGDAAGEGDAAGKGGAAGEGDATGKGGAAGEGDATGKGGAVGEGDATGKGGATGEGDATGKGGATSLGDAASLSPRASGPFFFLPGPPPPEQVSGLDVSAAPVSSPDDTASPVLDPDIAAAPGFARRSLGPNTHASRSLKGRGNGVVGQPLARDPGLIVDPNKYAPLSLR